jgi:hypothetical protein
MSLVEGTGTGPSSGVFSSISVVLSSTSRYTLAGTRVVDWTILAIWALKKYFSVFAKKGFV